MIRTVIVETSVEVDIDDVFEQAEINDVIKSFKEQNYDEDEVINALIELLKLDIIKTDKLKDFIKELKNS